MRNALAMLALAPIAIAADAPRADLRVELSGVRNNKGTLLLCLTARAEHFPDCRADPAARTLSLPAGRAGGATIGDLAPGRYALSVMHDENDNGRLETVMRIPREGFGFSRNPVVRFGAPKFRDVVFTVPPGASRVSIRMKYFL